MDGVADDDDRLVVADRVAVDVAAVVALVAAALGVAELLANVANPTAAGEYL